VLDKWIKKKERKKYLKKLNNLFHFSLWLSFSKKKKIMYAFVIKKYERKRKKTKKHILHDLTFLENIKNSEKYVLYFTCIMDLIKSLLSL
jgi:hypothetical protein